MPRTLQKIIGSSPGEIADRGKQKASALAERYGLSSSFKRLNVLDYLKQATLGGLGATEEEYLDHFLSRTGPQFYRSFDDRKETIAALRKISPSDEERIIRQADDVCDGFFDLLGHKRLCFGGAVPDWHLDPLSGIHPPQVHWSKIPHEDPAVTGDTKIIWELNRHQYFLLLGQAYWVTGDEKYSQVFAAHLADWIEENPPKTGINWMSSLEIAFRSISWIWAFHFFKDSPSLTPKLFAKMLQILHMNGRHLETYLSTYFSPNTHLTGEALGLYFLGTYFPEFGDASRWKGRGYDVLMDALDFQVRADGVYCEQSSHYHRYTTDFYANLLILLRLSGEPADEKHLTKLEQLFEFLLYITQPNGKTPLFGDEDGGRLYFLDGRPLDDFGPTLALGAVLFGRGDFRYVSEKAGTELLWLLGPQGLKDLVKIEPSEPRFGTISFDESGFYVMRDSWRPDGNFVLIDCGDHGFMNGGHAHADALSFVMSVGGEPVFIDSGTFAYGSDRLSRDLFRSTSAHNCLTVNGESSSEPGGPFSWKSTAQTRLVEWTDVEGLRRFKGSHDGFERLGVTYSRELSALKGEFELKDVVFSRKINSFELNFILSPTVRATINDGLVEIFRENERNFPLLRIYTDIATEENIVPGVWQQKECWVSDRFGAKAESTKLVYKMRAIGGFEIRNRFVFGQGVTKCAELTA